MTYNWYDFLVFARNLNINPTFVSCVCEEETIKRNIVSRSYYAAFHHAKNHAEDQGNFKFPKVGVHSAVQRWYKDKRQFKVLNDLRELSDWRDKCDYHDEISNLDKLVKDSLKGAERIHHYF
ncbi:MAG: hypothetical protein ABFC71_09940 [Methanoregula sp.]